MSKCQLLKIDELARLVHPRDGHKKVLAMLEAYLDESGIHDDASVCMIGGYYGGIGQWRKFEKAWRELLNEFGVPSAEFHALDLIGKRKFFRSWDAQRWKDFQLRIAQTIAIHQKIHPVSAAVIVSDFNSFPEKQRKFFTGGHIRAHGHIGGEIQGLGKVNEPYYLAFLYCTRQVACYAPVGGKAHFFYGLDRAFSKYALVLFQKIKLSPRRVNCKERLGDIDFPLAKDTPQLQAADFFVHLSYRFMSECYKAGTLGQTEPSELIHLCIANKRCDQDFALCDKDYMKGAIAESEWWFGKW